MLTVILRYECSIVLNSTYNMFFLKRMIHKKQTQVLICDKVIINYQFKQLRLNIASVANIENIEASKGTEVIKPKLDVIKKKRNVAPSKEVLEYLAAKNSFKHALPNKLLKRKRVANDGLYLVDKDVAQKIGDMILPYIYKNNKVKLLEANPGLGLLTKYLLDAGVSNINLIEGSNHYAACLNELYEEYPKNVVINYADFFSLAKLSYQDKHDNGDRVKNIFTGIELVPWRDDFSMRIVGAMASVNFIKYMIASLVLQQGLFSYGRCELFLTMAPYSYVHLTCGKEAGYLNYRATSIMFQILFDYKLLGKLPRKSFLPWETDNTTRNSAKVRNMDSEYIYLVRIVPKKNLSDLCATEYLQQLWYFVRHHCLSRKNRIIPHLERWIPNCGTRLISNSANTFQSAQIFNTNYTMKEHFSHQNCQISNTDYYPNMTIFTQFGDLSPSQLLTVFHQFSSWPEYPESPFLASMENSLMKMENTAVEADDDIEQDEHEEIEKEP